MFKTLGTLAIFCFLAYVLTSCGDYRDVEYEEAPPVETDKAFLAIKPIVDKECGRCHNGQVHPLKFNSSKAFKESKAKDRIANGSMPPDRPLDARVKAQLLAYLGRR